MAYINSNCDLINCLNKEKSECGLNKTILIKIGIVSLFFIGCFTLCYFYNSDFSTILNKNMSIIDSLRYIALPIAGVSILIGTFINFYKNAPKQVKIIGVQNRYSEERKSNNFKMKLIRGIIFLAISVLIVIGYLIIQYTPSINHAVQAKIKIWEAIAYIGGGSIFLTSIISWAISFFHNKYERDKYIFR